MKALLFGALAEGQGYPRIRTLTGALESLGVELARLTRPLDRRSQGRARRSPAGALIQAARLFAARGALLRAGRALHRPDLVLVGHPAQAAADLPGRIWPGVPVVVDLFLSAYDTVVVDRRLVPERSLRASWLRRLDRRAARAGSLVLVDTPQMGLFAAGLTGLPPTRFRTFPCGDPDAPASPAPYLPPRPGEPLRALYVGTGVPLHGLEQLLDAVRRVPGVELVLVGGGPPADRLLAAGPCARVRRVAEWVDRSALGSFYRECHLALGIFGDSPKAGRVVPLKVFHGLAEGRPVLTGESEAVSALLAPGRELLTCPRGSAPALAEALARLCGQPGRLAEVAREGARAFRERFSPPAMAARMREILADLGLFRRGRPAPAPEGLSIAGGRR